MCPYVYRGLAMSSGFDWREAMSRVPGPRRIFEIALCLALLLFLAPVMALVTIAILVTDPGPILFGHKRLGKDGCVFRCWKFRSMVVDADARLDALLAVDSAARAEWQRDHKLRDDPRITGVGSFLRRSSLDELPQLFNVISGEMGLVGPRPIVSGEVSKYGRYFNEYCRVKPGITGLWQISGRNDMRYRRRVAIDVTYAREKSLRLDCFILALTLPRVLLAKGSY